MKALAIVISLSALVGCGTVPPMTSADVYINAGSSNSRVIKSPKVQWVATEDAIEVCNALAVFGGKQLVEEAGCALWNSKTGQGLIFTKQHTTTAILGHELFHIFKGHWHDAGGIQIED